MLVGFFALVLTGLPQKFYDTHWASWVVESFGGINRTRNIHRFFGLLFAVQFALHMLYGLYFVLIKRRVPAIVPTLKDAKDAVQSFLYCLRLTDESPRYGRFEWKQKFEYWGLIVGGALMIFTGLALWLPNYLSLIIPAEVIPVSRVAHSSEAFLAFSVIIFWHLYSVTLNPEVFPLDTVIFTGRMSEKRMQHEHPLEYEEILRQEAESEAKQEPEPPSKANPEPPSPDDSVDTK